MRSDDLDALDNLLAAADAVVPLKDARFPRKLEGVIGLRHDVDSEPEVAVKMARWEYDRGYRSTYFFLHTAPYWRSRNFLNHVQDIAQLGHEIGIHTNALAEAYSTDDDPDWILDRALRRLRSCGVEVIGVAGHGDARCYAREPYASEVAFVNHEHFIETPFRNFERPRWVGTMKIDPRPLARFGLEYEALTAAPRVDYVSDSGGKWNKDPREAIPSLKDGFVQVLQHPDWWRPVFCG